jgi:hypothetical protein
MGYSQVSFDFGLAVELLKAPIRTPPSAFGCTGTSRYMAVEVIRKHCPQLHKTDVFLILNITMGLMALCKPMMVSSGPTE